MRDLNLPGRPDSFSAAASAPKKPKGRPRKPKPEQSVPAATSDEQSATFDESKPPTEGVPGEEVPPTFEPPNDVTSGEKPVVRKRRRGGGPGSRGGTGRGRGRGRGALVSSEVEAPEQTAAAETEASSETGDEPPISRPRLTARLKLRPAARSRSSSSASTESPEDEEPEHSPAAEPDDVQPQESTTDSSSIVAEEPEPSATATSSTSINSSPDNAAAGDKAQDDNAESVSGEAEEARNIIAPCLISRSGRHIVPNPKFFNWSSLGLFFFKLQYSMLLSVCVCIRTRTVFWTSLFVHSLIFRDLIRSCLLHTSTRMYLYISRVFFLYYKNEAIVF